MTRQEQINEMAKEVAAYLTYDKDIQVAFADVLRRGAQWADEHPGIDVRTMAAWRGGYKEAIERACEWLDNELQKYIMEGRESKPYISVALMDEFKKDFGL